MKRCSQCGTEVDDDLAVSCPNCGSTFAPSGTGVPYSPRQNPTDLVYPPKAEKVSLYQKILHALRLSRKRGSG